MPKDIASPCDWPIYQAFLVSNLMMNTSLFYVIMTMKSHLNINHKSLWTIILSHRRMLMGFYAHLVIGCIRRPSLSCPHINYQISTFTLFQRKFSFLPCFVYSLPLCRLDFPQILYQAYRTHTSE